jgi:acyl-coenzyme A thioesterase PaaI-like protein
MLNKEWNFLKNFPGGNRVFSQALRWLVPYSGRLGAVVLEVGLGNCRVRLKDRRGVRNHLQSVHAMALANLAEMASGMALVYALPEEQRSILVEFKITYLKKARGTLEARSRFDLPKWGPAQEVLVPVSVFNAENEEVCRAEARWRIGPKK